MSNTKKEILKNLINIKNIIIYIITFMVSTVGMGQEVSPFSIAIIGASLASGVPAIFVVIAGLIGNIVGVGTIGALNYVLITLMLLILLCIKPPKENDEYSNEQIRISKHIFFSVILVMVAKLMLTKFTIGDLILHIILATFSVIFYKIFVNSLTVLQSITERKAFSVEEVMGASLMLAIATSAFGNIGIYGLKVSNILSIFIVLMLGWRNGILVGATAGVTIGVTIGIISQGEPSIIAVYALSGMIAGILNKFGKIGVIIGFLIGCGILVYGGNEQLIDVIFLKETLIASLGLLILPKWAGIDIEELRNKEQLLPEYNTRGLSQNEEAINQLNMVSETIKDMAKTYAEKNNIEEDIIVKNRQKFITEFLSNIDGLDENILYEDLSKSENQMLNDIFDILLEKQEINKEDLIKSFAKNNNYIVEYNDEKISKKINEDIEQMVKAVNYAYKTSKNEFIWEEKIKTNKKNVQAQLDGVSKAISSIAVKMEQDIKSNTENEQYKKEIIQALEIKDILVKDVEIEQKDNRYFIDIYLKEESKTSKNTDIDKMQKILEKILNEPIMINEPKNKKLNKLGKRIFSFLSADKYILQIGQATKIKNDNLVSGDSILQTRLNDGKYLLAISDGMGSGPEARKSSQIAIKMLERLLMSGFDKDTSIELINTTIINTNEEIFATLDIAIIDLYNGKIEFIKNGACPTYIKNKKKINIIKSLNLPAGILKEINLTTYDKDIENKDIVVMCSDGIIDSNMEYQNKELWLKYVLEDLQTVSCQKIADLVLNEAIDNNYGIAKDDMSVVVCKLTQK